MPELAAWQWALGAVCGLFSGIAKTGMPGIAIVIVPMMVLIAGEARVSPAWLLPLLLTGDAFAIVSWRRHASRFRLTSLAPWVAIGIAGGAFALGFSERVLRPMIGAIITVMFVLYLVRRWRPNLLAATSHPAPYGVAAGFATTVANAAGPVMNLFLLGQKLPKEEFIGTGAWFFFLVNLSKIPIYASHSLFTRQSILFDVIVSPAVIVGALTGRWMVRHISPALFEWIVIFLTAAAIPLLFR
ncbi:MAG: sulfite exporter TauE/SafE family protein [Hyphomicrobium sp.]